MKRNVLSVPLLSVMLALLALVLSGGCGGSDHGSLSNDSGESPTNDETPVSNIPQGGGAKLLSQ